MLSRHWPVAVAVILLGSFAAGSTCAQEQKDPAGKIADPEHIGKLIENLGSSNFLKRDQATKDLEAIGAPALELLRKAAKHKNAELSSRAARLVALLEERAQIADMLAPSRVRLNVSDVPLRVALAELARKSGCTFAFAGDSAGLAEHRVTLDTGEVSYWEAVQLLSRKAGLFDQANESAAKRTLVFKPMAGPELPVCLAGSVRIRALSAKAAPGGEYEVLLDVAGEPRLRNFGVVGSIVVDKAIDDQGQVLLPTKEKIPPPPPAPKPANRERQTKSSAGAYEINGHDLDPPDDHVSLRRTLPIRLKVGSKPAKMLKELTGKVSVLALAKPEVVLTLSDIGVGRTQSAHGYTLEVHSVEKLDEEGRLKIQVTLTAPQGPYVGDYPFGFLFGRTKVLIDGVPLSELPGGGGRPAPTMPKLIDAQGQVYQPQISKHTITALGNRDFGFMIVNGTPQNHILPGRFQHKATLAYRPSAAPAQLQLYGQRLVTFDVPFRLTNVPLAPAP